MPKFRSSRPALSVFCDFLLALAVFSLVIVAVAADSAGARTDLQPTTYTLAPPVASRATPAITPLPLNQHIDTARRALKSGRISNFNHTAGRLPAFKQNQNELAQPARLAARALITTDQSTISPFRSPSANASSGDAFRHMAMILMALMFATIFVAIQRSTRHLRKVLAAPHKPRWKRQ